MQRNDVKLTLSAENKIKGVFAEVKSELGSLKDKVFSVQGAIVSALGVGGLGVYTKLTADAVVSTTAYARAMNMSTQELSAWQQVAALANIDGEKMSDIFKDISEKIGDAFLTGGGEAMDVIQKLNLDLNTLVGMTPDKQLLAIARALDQVGSTSEKVLILESLASDASLLLPYLENDASKLRVLRDEVIQTGAAINGVDAEKIKQADEALKRAQGVMTGMTNQMIAEFAPIIEVSAIKMKELALETDGFGVSASEALNIAVEGSVLLIGGLEKMQIGWQTIKVAVIGFAAVAMNAYNGVIWAMGETNKMLLQVGLGSQTFATGVELMDHMTQGFNNALGDENQKLLDLIANSGKAGEKLRQFAKEVVAAANDTAQQSVAPVLNQTETVDPTTTAAYQNAVLLNAALYQLEVQAANERRVALEIIEYEHAQEMIQLHDQIANNFASGMGNAVADVIVEQQSGVEALKNLFKGLVKQIIASYTTMMIRRQIFAAQTTAEAVAQAKALGATWAGPATLAATATAGGAAVAGQTAIDASYLNSLGIAARERGGPVYAGETYLVGEKGPELFTAGRTGYITPNSQTSPGGNTYQINHNTNIYTATIDQIEEVVRDSPRRFLNALFNAMHDTGMQF